SATAVRILLPCLWRRCKETKHRLGRATRAVSGNAFLLELKATPQFGRPAGPQPEAVGADESRVGTQLLSGACSPERAHKAHPLLPLRHSRPTGSLGRSRSSGASTLASRHQSLQPAPTHIFGTTT